MGRSIVVREVAAEDTWPLRRAVLRGGDPGDVAFAEDERPGAFHLGAADDDGTLLGVASFSPEPSPHRPGVRAVRLRGMAVDPAAQGRGLGRALLDEAVDRLRSDEVAVLWANGRDRVEGFYTGLGWSVVGEGFVTGPAALPHHVVLLDL